MVSKKKNIMFISYAVLTIISIQDIRIIWKNAYISITMAQKVLNTRAPDVPVRLCTMKNMITSQKH